MKFKGDIILTDPLYIIRKDSPGDCQKILSEGYDHAALQLLGINTYLSAESGEDGRLEVQNNAGEHMGKFCTDSCLYCVCDFKQVLSYNPNFLSDNANCSDCFCVIRDFDGEVSVTIKENKVKFIGTGKNGFQTV